MRFNRHVRAFVDGAWIEDSVARVTPLDEEIERLRRKVTIDMTRAIVSLVLATGFAVLVRRWQR